MASLLLAALLLDAFELSIVVWLTGTEDATLEISMAEFLLLSGCCNCTAEGAMNPNVKMRVIERGWPAW